MLTGGGTVDGQGAGWWARHLNGSEGNVTRSCLFEVEYSDGILLEDITFTNSPFWTLHPTYSSNVVARRLNISHPLDSPNTDGFDPDSCENASFVDSVYVGGDASPHARSATAWMRQSLQPRPRVAGSPGSCLHFAPARSR